MAIEKTGEGLNRVIGVPGLALSIVNGVIGSGIFALPAIVGIAMGAFGVFSYIFCSIMLAAIMLCYAEVGSRITSSGGSYAYVEAAFGNFAGFIINWLYFFGWGILGSAAVTNIIADSLAVLFPVFSHPVLRGFFFFVLIGFIVMLNVRGTKQGIGFVKGITVIKLLPLLGIIIFGIGQVKAANLQWEHLPSLKTFGDTALVLFFAFAGFETSLGVSGEFKNPKRTVPLGILLGGITVLIVYMLLQMVTQGILGAEIASYKDAPLAAVAEKIIGPVGATILLITAAISCFGSVSADIMATPRSLFAGANDNMFPGFLGKVHPKFATPHLAIITYGTLIFIFSVSGGFKQLAILASAAILLIYLAVILATVKLRKQASPEKTFRAPGGLIFPFIGIASIIWLLSSLSKWEILSTGIFIAAVCVIYFVMKRFKK
ncbi:MAG: amino acid permease [Chitinophagaceae bacterium]|nr:amino acid permease [Chitinophagaceae bacterium]MBK7559135.1 amino acid permease [Chitinophagaceae bacterium]MBK9533216.1 amino acid permease [Chitinophagaceae bacterium]HQW91926.1 amino acid permease [Ferruginibacter sp.]